MKTKILKQENLEKKREKLFPKYEKLGEKELKLKKKIIEIEEKYKKAKHKTWLISEKIAGLNGLISMCKNGKIKVGVNI